MFAYNAIRYLGGGGATEQGPVRPGGTLRIPLPEGVVQAELLCPNGTRTTISPDIGGMAYFGGTEQAGVYRVTYNRNGEEREDRYAVNLEDTWESNIRPRGAAEIARPQITAGQAITTATPEIWRWFIGGALVLVLLEWYIYNRRVMI